MNDNPTQPTVTDGAPPKKKFFNSSTVTLALTIALYSMLFILASGYIVSEYIPKPKATFTAPPPVAERVEKVIEHKIKVNRNKSRAESSSRASTVNRITSTGKSNITMPESLQFQSQGENFQAGLLGSGGMGGSGFGSGSGMGSGTGGIGVGKIQFKFMGVSGGGERIVVCFDISQSVLTNMGKTKYDINKVKEETQKLIESLHVLTMFGIIQHARNWDAFDRNLSPATPDNKAAVTEWLKTKFRTDGKSGSGWMKGEPNGIQSVLKGAFNMKPDTIFLVSDASYQRSTGGSGSENVPWQELTKDIDALQKSLPQPAKIHFIGFGVKEDDKKEMRKVISRNKGQYLEIQ